MSSVIGLHGFNRSGSSVNKIFAAYGNDIVDLAAGTGYGLNLTGNNVEMASFLDRVFLQDYAHTPVTYDGVNNVWNTSLVSRCMASKYLRPFKERMYLGNCKFPYNAPQDANGSDLTFPSRVFYSDLWKGNTLTWGLEWGRNGKTIGGTPYFELAQPITQDFVASNIKVGDPLFITSGNTQLASKVYYVASVESPLRLKVTEDFPVTATSLHFWVGSNWFDVRTDDNDQITGFGENSDRLMVSKLLSNFFYNQTSLIQIKGAVGTSSSRSVVNQGGYTYYFHGSQPKLTGIYRNDGVNSVKISRGIDPFIRAMSTSNYSSVVGWVEGEEIRFFIGNLTDTNYNISMTNAVATYHTVSQAWDVSPIADVITCATTYRTSNQEDTYCGTSTAQVMKMNSGNSHNGTPIRLHVETGPYYVNGTDLINIFNRIQVIARNGVGLKVKYRLYDNPKDIDTNFTPLGELTGDRTEFIIPDSHNQASGIELMFEETGSLENDLLIEKHSIFYMPSTRRIT